MAVNFIVALIIALLSGLGVGGGGLFAVYLAVFSDIPQLSVQGFNLLFFLFCASASVTVQIFRRRILFSAVAVMVATGLVGALIGTYLTGLLPEDWLRRAFGVMLVAGGLISLRSALREKQEKKEKKEKDDRGAV